MHKNPALRAITFTTLILCLATLAGCKSGSEKTASIDSLQTETVSNEELAAEDEDDQYNSDDEAGFDAPREIINYGGVLTDQNEHDLRTFQRLKDVLDQAQVALAIRDNLFYARGSDQVDGPLDDSIRATDTFKSAWRALENYKELMAPGYTFDDGIPGLLDLTRVVNAEDSSENYLPEPGESALLANGNYFVLGGAPFINGIQSDEGAAFESPEGKPEMRFETSVTENANYIFNFLLHMKTLPMTISYGPPLQMYDGWSRDVNGAGAIIHTFNERVPVYFLTTKGALPAELISVTVKLDAEGLGCVSDQPRMIFACHENISDQDILAVYIPENDQQKITFKYKIHNNALWTGDLNGDGVDDLACISSSFEGVADDSMAELLWFVNVNGEWKIIDYAQMLDCT
jgi:hypothetical protein